MSVSFFQGRIIISKDAFNLCISKPFCTLDNTLIELGMRNIAMMVKIHLCCEGKPVNIWVKTANAVAQCLWQHGYAPVREIYARPSFICLGIQMTLLFHIMSNISNRYPKLIALSYSFYGNRIIKILCSFAVNGNGAFIP